MGRIFSVVSGKGGTGKSTFSTTLALSFVSMKKRVLLLDLDAGLRCLDIILGIESKVMLDLSDVLSGRAYKDALCFSTINKNLALLPAPLYPIDINPVEFKKILTEVCNDFDIVILDFPAGLDFKLCSVLPKESEFITVCNSDPVSVKGAAAVCYELKKRNFISRLVINRFNPDTIKSGMYTNIDNIIDNSGIQLLGIMPESKDLLFLPVYHCIKKHSNAGRAIIRIANRLNGKRVPLPNPKKI